MNAMEFAEWIVSQKAEKRILLVDDDPTDAVMMEGVLEFLKATITHAHSGELAQELFKTASFDLAIVDIKLPQMNGLQFAQWLRANHPMVSVIIISGIDFDSTMVKLALDDGFWVRKKPLTAAHIQEFAQSINIKFPTPTPQHQVN